MNRKIVIVGGVAGGASVAARVRRLDAHADIVMLEKGAHVSFSNCSLPYYLGGAIQDSAALVMMTPQRFQAQYQIEARTGSEVTAIHREEQTVTVRREDGSEYEEPYDILVLAPGANPILPRSIQGIDLPHVFALRNVTDAEKLHAYLAQDHIRQVAVVGGGFIGMEVAENLIQAGKQVTVVEAADQIMAPFDHDMVQILHKELTDHQVTLLLGDGVQSIAQDHITLASGRTVPAQAVVMAIGVSPETTLARQAGLELGSSGGIKVDANFRTSDKHIYAVGDAIEVYHRLTHKPTRLALAGPAQRQARTAADHMYGIPGQNNGVLGSSAVRVFDLNAAATGLNEKQAQAAGIPYDFVYLIPMDKVGIMPGSAPLHFKLLFEVPTGRVLGAQAIGKGAADKRIDVIAAVIAMGGTLEDLKELELCYSPVFGTARDVVNQAALVGLNVLHGTLRQVPVSQIRALAESGAFIVDVREEAEFARGHIRNAVNIPLSQLRRRVDEIPQDRPVYLHCRSGQRSYNAYMALAGLGYENLWNLSGSFLGLCLYEYFGDLSQGREKIVTDYNFT